jgi:hypothetical protein
MLTIAFLSIAAGAVSFLAGAFYWEIRLGKPVPLDFLGGHYLDPEAWVRGSPKCPFPSDEQVLEVQKHLKERAERRAARLAREEKP